MLSFIVDTFILLYTVTSVLLFYIYCLSFFFFHWWNNKVFNFKWRPITKCKSEDVIKCWRLLPGEALGVGLIRMCCALWDGNGPHNQLELRITAALWVPLQSHPQRQASGPHSGLVGLILLKEKDTVVNRQQVNCLCRTDRPKWSSLIWKKQFWWHYIAAIIDKWSIYSWLNFDLLVISLLTNWNS